MATDNFWDRFSRWRRHRPFWGGLFLLLSAIELLYTANMNLGDLQIHLGPQGFLSYLLPIVLIICALLSWFTPAQRLFYGIIGVLTALYSFVGLNLGGFFAGMLLGIVGGALAIAWGPPRVEPGQDLTGLPPDGEPYGTEADPDGATEPHDAGSGPPEDVEQTRRIDIAGHDDRPHDEHLRPATQSAIVPGFDDQERPKSTASRLGKNPKALAAGLIVVGVSATVLVAGSHIPASADDCPAGLPSRSTSATAATAAAAAKAARAAGTAKKATAKATTKAATSKTTTTKTATATPSPSASTGSGNVIVDGITSLIDGVGNLLGLGDDASASPSTSPSSSESATASPSATATETTAPTQTTGTAATTEATKTTAATATASASSDDVPCLGARVEGLTAGNDGIPLVSDKPGLLETASLTMYDSTYDGVVELPTKSGATIRSLQFTMSKAVNKPFSLTVDEPNGGQTVVKSDELTVSSNVKFYTSRFEGKLFGLIPVVFTPDSPPPLTLPILWFTDAKIQLNLVRSDTLTGKPLKINETS